MPVVDITEAAASTAMYLGHKYSVVTTLDRAVPLIEDRLKLAGLDARCASVRASGLAVLELDEDPERAIKAMVDQAEYAVTQDKAEVIVLGCGGMSGLDAAIRERVGGAGGRWRRRRGDGRRITGAAGTHHLQGPHLRPTATQELQGLAATLILIPCDTSTFIELDR